MIRRHFLGLAASAAVFPSVARAQAAAGAAAPAPRPIEDFGALPFMDTPHLSPNGNKIAAKMAGNGTQFFAVHDLFGDSPPALIGAGKSDINWWRWVNDDWLVVGIGGVQSIQGDDFYLRRAIGVSVDGKKIVPLAFDQAGQNADDVLWVANDGTPRVRMALQKSLYLSDANFWPEVREFDVSTGHSKLVVASHDGVESWYADGTGTIRIGVGAAQEGRRSSLIYRHRDGDNFHTIERADSRKGEGLLIPALFLPEPDQALATDDKDGFNAVYKLDLTTMALGDKVFGVAGYDVDDIFADRERTRLLGATVIEDSARTHWLDPELASLQAAMDKAVPGRQATVMSLNGKRDRLIVLVAGSDRPGAYYFMDTGDGRLQRIANVNAKIGAAVLNPVRTIRYKARDGLEMSAVLTLPAKRAAKALPVAMMPHGGPFARDSEDWDWWAQSLAERGYAVMQPNFRGSSGFGTAFAKKGEGQWGLAMQDDVNDALAWLVKEGIGDPKRACVVGGSYGGYCALRAAQRDGSLYRCAVSFAGVSDLEALRKYDGEFLNSGANSDWWRTQAPDLKSVSPINFPEQFSTPVLLVHGKMDQRVPVKQSRQMADRLKQAGKQVVYVEQPLGDHFFSREQDRVGFLKAMDAFLTEHNPA
ncbi:MAG TPA: alpha/beta fold hydrolase [Allosphingosinicella sp.]|jgi:acetyl esterase/lipase|nr:alpha/beta fold hydrolase [Allosphingosinicella sp.]